MRQFHWMLAIALAVPLGLAACSEPEPEVQIVTVPAEAEDDGKASPGADPDDDDDDDDDETAMDWIDGDWRGTDRKSCDGYYGSFDDYDELNIDGDEGQAIVYFYSSYYGYDECSLVEYDVRVVDTDGDEVTLELECADHDDMDLRCSDLDTMLECTFDGDDELECEFDDGAFDNEDANFERR
ncbi:MAG: hypothetical protein ACI8PZ_001804 [Myxococcota bacterium]|jgi:hypothetical protein